MFDISKLNKEGQIYWENFNNNSSCELTELSKISNIAKGKFHRFTEGSQKKELFDLLCKNFPKDEASPTMEVHWITSVSDPENKDEQTNLQDNDENNKKSPIANVFWEKGSLMIKKIKNAKGRPHAGKPGHANKITIAIGIIGIAIGLYWLYTLSGSDVSENGESIAVSGNELPMIFIGFFTSILTAGFVNYIVATATSKPLFEMMQRVAYDTYKDFRFLRNKQKIKINFSLEDDQRVVVKIVHEFCYIGKVGDKVPFYISSDYRKYADIDPQNPPFRFEKIKIDGGNLEQELLWDNWVKNVANSEEERKQLYEDLTRENNNKLFYKKDNLVISDPNGELDFEFVIYNEYQLKDRMVWAFQGFSSDAVEITVNKENTVQNKGNLYMWINHPQADLIKIANKSNGLQDDGELKQNRCELNFRCDIVAYQGFELSWDFSK